MNRRELFRNGTRALLGVPAVLLGVQAAPAQARRQITVVLRPDSDAFRAAVVSAVMSDVKAGGSVRELLERNAAIGF